MSDLSKITEDDLAVLHLIEEHPEISQRMMARKSGLSLGKVNYCLRSLVDIGFVKMDNFKQAKHKSRYIYKLTPQGIKQKIVITKKFLAKKQAEYEKLYNYLHKE